MSYEDNVLIRLRRDYSKDELVAFALKTIKDKDIELGKLKSYIDELEFNLKSKESELILKNKSIKSLNFLVHNFDVTTKQSELYQEQKEKIQLLKSDLNRFRKLNNELINKQLNK